MSQSVNKHKIWGIVIITVSVILGIAWVSTPTEWTFNLMSDNETARIAESVQNPVYVCVTGGRLQVMAEEVVDLRDTNKTFCAWFREADY